VTDPQQAHIPLRVCFVCTGNICRSPMGEVVLSARLAEAGLADLIVVDSAGTGPWHVGKDMDPRARATLVAHGYDPAAHVAKQFGAEDFATRDVVLALDSGHLSRLRELAGTADDPDAAAASIELLRSHDAVAVAAGDLDVPDPYYDELPAFEQALREVESACARLPDVLRERLESRVPL
jgi:protein-tyrosine phosphatase